MDEVTHFADGDTVIGEGFFAIPEMTLCGLPITSIVMTDKPARCPTCSDIHAAHGWIFPLPATVTA